MDALLTSDLQLPKFRKGKVRDSYELGRDLLMIATDRLSAFDVVFNEGIPHKGEVLNKISIFWFSKTKNIIENHFLTDQMPPAHKLPGYLNGRSMIVKRTEPLMLECVVRGYITGSGWKEYQQKGTVCGIVLPKGLKNGSKLPKPIFTPSTKAEKGLHDENISENKAIEIVGKETYKTIKQKSLELYEFARDYVEKHGLILADTKFEFGKLSQNGKEQIILIDEALTPDSSRYWLKEKYDLGVLESMDKQFVRDYLEKLGWNKSPPPPPLPKEIIEKTSKRYLDAYEMITGENLDL
ncbi:phosphoribosylaminoimidazolesuccinocarboxamide synthase [Candidatus Micrarchaeota archaeon]|nr:phosphoribosylaminoimidazolesuccinocarboxamide synthase [Candidatus Micrarchaeota archaeon]